MKSLKNVEASFLNKNQLKTLKGGNAIPVMPSPQPEDKCPYTNPDGTFNKDSGWCGSGPGGQGTFPS